MLPRLIFIFAFLTLLVLALKRGAQKESAQVQPVPGYPAPVALKTFQKTSDEEFLNNLPSALDYAQSFSPEKENKEVMGPEPAQPVSSVKAIKQAKRSVATKLGLKKSHKTYRKVKL